MLPSALFGPNPFQSLDSVRQAKDLAEARAQLAEGQRDLAERTQDLLAKRVRAVDESGLRTLEGRDFAKAAKQVVRHAVKSMAREIKGVLKSMGIDGSVAKDIAKAFTQPVKQALREGADFTARIAFAAARQTTVVTGAGVSQSTSLVAKSLDITVNHTTGEFSIQMQSLSVEQNVSAGFSEGLPELPPLPLPLPPEPAPPVADEAFEEIQDLLEEAAPAAQPAERESAPAATREAREELDELREIDDEDDDDLDEVDDDDEDDLEIRPAVLEELLRSEGDDDDGDDGEEVGLGARFRVRSVEQFQNSLGEFLTRVRLDVAVSLDLAIQRDPSLAALLDGDRPGGFDITA